MQKKKTRAASVIAAAVILLFSTAAFGGWSIMPDVPTLDKLRGVAAYSDNRILAVGDNGAVVMYDGTTWESVEQFTDKRLYGAFWISENLAYISADKGRIFKYDGSEWTELDSGTDKRLRTVWGTAADNIFAGGDSGTMLHFDGTTWSVMESATDDTIQGIYGASGSDVYAVGGPSGGDGTGNGFIVHYDGTAWSGELTNVTPRLKAVWTDGADTRIAVGDDGTVVEYDAVSETWNLVTNPAIDTIMSMWAISSDSIFAAGFSGQILEYDGIAWELLDVGVSVDLHDIDGVAGGKGFAVGDKGTILMYEPEGGGNDNGTADCPFEAALENENDLTLLRSLRDSRLSNSNGFDMVGLFYRHAREMAKIVSANPELKSGLQGLVKNQRGLFTELLATGQATVSRSAVDAAAAFLSELKTQAGPGLKMPLTFVEVGLKSGWLLKQAGIQVK